MVLYCYKVMPFGLENVRATYQRLVNGFIVNVRRVEANPKKIKALIEVPSPTKPKEVQASTGRMVALNIFISKLTDKCLPFFNFLRGNKKFERNEECEKAFKGIKKNLSTHLVLAKPMTGETLYLYLVVLENAISLALVQEEGKN
uniref:Reverse transcriptase/retrotransposon-derived protein RNase H-like domain-containing protein n=1 Tax=Cannabis sativa TaxID=3483 RepID=A0A803QCA0_CANSA